MTAAVSRGTAVYSTDVTDEIYERLARWGEVPPYLWSAGETGSADARAARANDRSRWRDVTRTTTYL